MLRRIRRWGEIVLILLGLLVFEMFVLSLQAAPPEATYFLLGVGVLTWLVVRAMKARARRRRMDAVFARPPLQPDGIRHTDFAEAAGVTHQQALAYLNEKAKVLGIASVSEYEQGGYGWERFPFPAKPSDGKSDAVT